MCERYWYLYDDGLYSVSEAAILWISCLLFTMPIVSLIENALDGLSYVMVEELIGNTLMHKYLIKV